MSWRDQPRGYGGDTYRPRNRSRHRSRSRTRQPYNDGGNRNNGSTAQQPGPSRADLSTSVFDEERPPIIASVEPPHPPRDGARDKVTQPPTGPAAMAQDPRLAKKPLVSFKMGAKDDVTATAKIVDVSEQIAKPVQIHNTVTNYLKHLVQLAVLDHDTDTVNMQLSEKESQKRKFLDLHPEAKEVHMQIDTMTEQLRNRLKSICEAKQEKEIERDRVLDGCSAGMKNFLNGILPVSQTKAVPLDSPTLDAKILARTVQPSEDRDKLRSAEKRDQEKEKSATEENWLARIKILEERDRQREEEVKILKADLLSRLKELEQTRVHAPSNGLINDISELKNAQKDQKLKLANIGNAFLPAREFRDFQKEFGEFKKVCDSQLIKPTLETTYAKTTVLEDMSKRFEGEITTLAKNMSEVKSGLDKFEERESKYAQIWTSIKDRLDSVEQRTTVFGSLPEELAAVNKKLESQLASVNTRQQTTEEKISALRKSAEASKGLQTQVDNLFDFQDQRFQAFIKMAQQDLQAFITRTEQDAQAIVGPLTVRSLQGMNPAERKELDKIKVDVQRVEHVSKNLNLRCNQLSTGILYKQMTSWLAPSLARIPNLEEFSKTNHVTLTNIEKTIIKIVSDFEDTKRQIAQSDDQTAQSAEISEKFSALEEKFAEVSRCQKESIAYEGLADLQTRLQRLETLETQLPILYYTKENGDDLDKRCHLLEALEIKDDLQDLRQKHAIIKNHLEEQQREGEENRDDIKLLQDLSDNYAKSIKEVKESCDTRQQEIDAREGITEGFDLRLSKVEKTLQKLAASVERIDDEFKTDIHTMKQEIANSVSLSFLHLTNLSSKVKTVEKLRSLLQPHTVHQAWFGGKKPDRNDKKTTYNAIIAVNKVDATPIKATFDRNQEFTEAWHGRTVHISVIEDHNRLRDLLQQAQILAPISEFEREATTMSSHQNPLLSSSPASSLARTTTVGRGALQGSGRTVRGSGTTDTVLVHLTDGVLGTRATPLIIVDSQEQDETAQNDGDSSGNDVVDDDTIELKALSDPTNISAWQRRPPTNTKARNSPVQNPRTSSITPDPSRKRSNHEARGGASKRARQI